MIDFKNAAFVKMGRISPQDVAGQINPLLSPGETIWMAARGMRDYVVFTNRRLITVNVQGITGRKVAYTSLPFSKLQAFSIETAGTIDMDSELDLWYSGGLGNVHLEFTRGTDIAAISRFLSDQTL